MASSSNPIPFSPVTSPGIVWGGIGKGLGKVVIVTASVVAVGFLVNAGLSATVGMTIPQMLGEAFSWITTQVTSAYSAAFGSPNVAAATAAAGAAATAGAAVTTGAGAGVSTGTGATISSGAVGQVVTDTATQHAGHGGRIAAGAAVTTTALAHHTHSALHAHHALEARHGAGSNWREKLAGSTESKPTTYAEQVAASRAAADAEPSR